MSTDANGNFSLPPSYFVQTGDTVLPVQHNPPFESVAQGLTNRVMKDGRTVMTGNLQMGGNRVTNVADPAFPSDAMTRRVSGFGFETRADAEAWPGVDPMPPSIVIRGDASVEDGRGGLFALGHPSSDTLVTKGTSYGRVIPPFRRASVLEFGVVGDGVHDDTAAIQAALESPLRDALYFPSGVYRTTEYLRLYQGTDILLSPEATILRHVGSGSRAYIFINQEWGDTSATGYDGVGNIRMRGGALTFTNDSENGIAFAIAHAKGFHIRDMDIYNWRNRHMADIAGCQDVSFIGCNIHDANYIDTAPLDLHEAIQIDHESGGSWPPGGSGDGTTCDNVLIAKNTFRNVATAVGTHHSVENKHTNIKIIDNFIADTISDAIRARHYVGAIISGNQIINAGLRALLIQQNTGSLIDANVLTDAGNGSSSTTFFNNSTDCVYTKSNITTYSESPTYTSAVEIGASGNPSTGTIVDIGLAKKGTQAVLRDVGIGTVLNGSHRIILANNQAASIPLPYDRGAGTALVHIGSDLSTGVANPKGLFWVNCGSSTACQGIAFVSETDTVLTTGVLSGNTGPSGSFSISAGSDGRLYLENRSGSPRNMAISFMGALP